MSQNEQDGDEKRYESAIGWEPEGSRRELTKEQKLLMEEYRLRVVLGEAIEVRTAREWLEQDARDENGPIEGEREPVCVTELFPPFWYPGQLAVFTGEPGVGKSLVAVQIAEGIATGSSGATVLYIDLERTGRQLHERYTHGGVRYEFSKRIEFGRLLDKPTPHKYRGRRERFLRDAVIECLRQTNAEVVIIDNLSWLIRSGGETEVVGLVKTFRRWVNEIGCSVMLLLHSPDEGKKRRIPNYAAYVDSVFALRHSTMHRNIRYVKQLFPRETGQQAVVGYELIRSPRLQSLALVAPEQRAPALPSGAEVATPFFGFAPLGFMPEEMHTRDYAAEAKGAGVAVKVVEERFGNRRKFVTTGGARINFMGIEEN